MDPHDEANQRSPHVPTESSADADLLEEMIAIHREGLELTNHMGVGHMLDVRGRITLRFMKETLKSMLVAKELWLRAYYHQSLSVARTIFEFSVTSRWLARHPEKVSLWLRRSTPKEMPKFMPMIDEIVTDASDIATHRMWYSATSEFVHPRYMTLVLNADTSEPTYNTRRAREVGDALLGAFGMAFLPLDEYVGKSGGLPTYWAWNVRAQKVHHMVQNRSGRPKG